VTDGPKAEDLLARLHKDRGRRPPTGPCSGWPGALLVVLAAAAACVSSPRGDARRSSSEAGLLNVVAAENEYGNVAAQVGGRYVHVTSVVSNPNTDPHDYEVSPSVATAVAAAQLVVQNGLGYDDFMSKIEAASPDSRRRIVDVQQLLGLPDDTPNPHLWYDPHTMPKVANAIASDLSELDPAKGTYFRSNARRFDGSLAAWTDAIAAFDAAYPHTPVSVSEPVADYMLQAAGTKILTPFSFQADVMNGVDPPPQDVSTERSLFSEHEVKVFVYNQQVTDSLTESLIGDAQHAGIPVVGVYETMPEPGYDYQSWMLAEVNALRQAVAHGVSTARL
jgi:zinc/manganese transport system substrate-binding protein